MMIKPADQPFADWVVENGGEILAATNPYVRARFRGEGGKHVIYESSKGTSFSSDAARDYLYAVGVFWAAFEWKRRTGKFSMAGVLVALLWPVVAPISFLFRNFTY